jgi:hypothetical protein
MKKSLYTIRLSGYPVIRLSGYPVIRLSGYPVIRLSGYPVIRLPGYPVIRLSTTRVFYHAQLRVDLTEESIWHIYESIWQKGWFDTFKVIPQ